MALISFICLLTLSSSAFGRSAYRVDYEGTPMSLRQNVGSIMLDQTTSEPLLIPMSVPTQAYELQQPQTDESSSAFVQYETPIQQRPQSTYGTTPTVPTLLKTSSVQSYGQVNEVMFRTPQIDQKPQSVSKASILTAANRLCMGKTNDTIILLDKGRKFVVCIDNGKGFEQKCPRGLYYREKSRRCERKHSHSRENICASQPCLNGGQCVVADFTYQCQCAEGFVGQNCEFDARICHTEQPCGQAPGTQCQSFRWGAALQYICIFQNGLAYGLNPQQVQPNPCQGFDGTRALTMSRNGFIMCDGDRMFIETCPGGTVWNDTEKACAWPEEI